MRIGNVVCSSSQHRLRPSVHLADLVEREQLVLGRHEQAVARLRLLQRLCQSRLSAQHCTLNVLATCIQGTLRMRSDLQAGLSNTAQGAQACGGRQGEHLTQNVHGASTSSKVRRTYVLETQWTRYPGSSGRHLQHIRQVGQVALIHPPALHRRDTMTALHEPVIAWQLLVPSTLSASAGSAAKRFAQRDVATTGPECTLLRLCGLAKGLPSATNAHSAGGPRGNRPSAHLHFLAPVEHHELGEETPTCAVLLSAAR